MGLINKGKIGSIEGNTARVVPMEAGARPTAKITIPWHLRGRTGELKKGTPVVYVEFEDSTGLLLGRADGEWGEYLPYLEVDKAESLDPAGDILSNGVSLKDHTHAGDSGGSTSKPR